MKRAATFAFLALLFCDASASWDSLDSMNLPAELEPVNEDIIPRLLQEVLGDAAVPGAYGAAAPTAAAVEKATPAAATPAEAPVTTTTPAAEPITTYPAAAPAAATTTPAEVPAATTTTTPVETPITTVVQPTQQTVVEAPTPEPAVATPAETAPAPATTETTVTTTTTTDAAAPAAAPASVAVIPAEASVCPAGSKRADYSSGTMFCVLAAQGDSKGELHISNGAGKAIPSGNSCFAAPCAAPSSSSMGRKMLRWLHATESAQAEQRAEFLPFLLAIARAVQPVQMDSAATLAHSKCFYVCEAEASSMGH